MLFPGSELLNAGFALRWKLQMTPELLYQQPLRRKAEAAIYLIYPSYFFGFCRLGFVPCHTGVKLSGHTHRFRWWIMAKACHKLQQQFQSALFHFPSSGARFCFTVVISCQTFIDSSLMIKGSWAIMVPQMLQTL